jgi:hypothetical protein
MKTTAFDKRQQWLERTFSLAFVLAGTCVWAADPATFSGTVPVDATAGAQNRDPLPAAIQGGTFVADDANLAGPTARVWADAEYLLWWIRGAPMPVPLVTQGNSTTLGALGQPGTSVVAGGSDMNFGPASGGRFTLGAWLDDARQIGLDGNYLFLSRVSNTQTIQSDSSGQPLFAIPFVQPAGVIVPNPNFTPIQPGETSSPISLPGHFAGVAVIASTSQLQGSEINLTGRLVERGGWRIDALGGFRYINLTENFSLDTSSANFGSGDVFMTHDQFDTRNNFYGGQLGTRVAYSFNRLLLALSAKVALGSMQEAVHINGGLLTNDVAGVPAVTFFPGGYLAQPTNIGNYHQGAFAVIPEVGVRTGWQLTRWARLSVGYNFLYLSNVVRPGDQIDRTINPLQAPAITGNPPAALTGPAQPAFQFHTTDYLAHGVTIGLGLQY